MRRNSNDAFVVSRIFSVIVRTASPEHYRHCQFKLLCVTSNSSITTNSFSPLLRRCIEGKSISGVKCIHAHMLKCGFPVQFSGGKLVDASLKCGEIGYARQLFDEMPVRHIVTWNSMIASCIKHGRNKEAVTMYNLMVMEGISPDEYTLSSVCKAFSELGLNREGRRCHSLAVILGLEVSNVFVGSALVDMYVKFGKTSEAKLVLNRMKEKDVVLFTALIVGCSQNGEDLEAVNLFKSMAAEGVKGNEYTYSSVLTSCGNLKDIDNGRLIHGLMVTWTSLISGLVQNGREEMALTKFRRMMRSLVTPNSFTFSSVLGGCSNLAMFEEGRQIHAIVVKHGLDQDKYVGAGLIDLYGKCGCADMARSVFDSLKEVDVVSVNMMIYSYAQNSFGQEALELYKRMGDMGLEQNNVTIMSILLACKNSGLVEEGCEIFGSIRGMEKNNKTVLTHDHYACMVDLLGRAGRLEEAEMLIINHVTNPGVVLWRTLLCACKIHKHVEMAERIKKKILEIAPGDEGTLILMSNLYAASGKWNRVIEMKSEMREMKLKKDPAMSWVEVDKEKHSFMAGDLSHPNSEHILETLEELIKKAKDLGYVEDKSCVFQDMDESAKERSLYYHSEKLALAFAVWRNAGKAGGIRILKNLRVCADCHNWIKMVSTIIRREIICRDAKRFHHFKDGSCSCGDYW
ncbi:PREDICTED: pentatricopeptide repeat-containing protein At5g65570 isoform X2 [Tarenaya hassleriana]|uniref:pentatricopeptide repeat-containing protein At5g65570 isoform X2 n=1 Tax=Tarenaya hassleriana TaxID=28532 RepID=UPI00053C30E0|nr:PREDICTED: pentatricopeptide repeat-containing protein At5g65570 isoform X2 [Tarenaya hassleriana]